MERDYFFNKMIDRTETGLLLCIIGFALSWIPYIQYLGLLLIFIGLILLILGRDAFSQRHGAFVILGFILLIATFALSFILAFSLFFSLLANLGSTSGVESAFKSFLIEVLAVSIIGGMYQVLVAYEISDHYGKILLISAFVIAAAIPIGLTAIILPQVNHVLSQSLSGGNPAQLAALESQLNVYRLLDAIPGLMFAYAYYLARSRIVKGIIPPGNKAEEGAIPDKGYL